MRAHKSVTLIVSIVVASGLGCGGDICDKADQASRNLANAAASCPSYSAGMDGGVSTFAFSSNYSKATCQNALRMCSAADQQALSNTFDCFSKVNQCVPGRENQFLGSVLSCVFTASSVSQACGTAFAH